MHETPDESRAIAEKETHEDIQKKKTVTLKVLLSNMYLCLLRCQEHQNTQRNQEQLDPDENQAKYGKVCLCL